MTFSYAFQNFKALCNLNKFTENGGFKHTQKQKYRTTDDFIFILANNSSLKNLNVVESLT